MTAVCCFTPVLVVALGAIGLAAWSGHLDLVLLLLPGVFVLLVVAALVRRARAASQE